MRATKLFYISTIAAILQLSSCGGNDEEPQTIPTLSTAIPTNVTGTTASVSGEITDDGNADITEAGVLYSDVEDEPTEADTRVAATSVDNFTVELEELDPETTYYVRAYAINKKGIGYGNVRSFQTGPETVTFMYAGQQVTYGVITSTTTQMKWLDRNLGASRLAQTINDHQAYGDLFQWGRAADGHQRITRTGINNADASGITGRTSMVEPFETSEDDTPETDKFIITQDIPYDWRAPLQNNSLWQGVNGTNNPCPAGWRVPTVADFEAEGLLTGSDAFVKLKLTYSGQRSSEDGNVYISDWGVYWTSNVREMSEVAPDIFASLGIAFNATNFYPPAAGEYTSRGYGHAIRCIKD